MLPFLPPLTAAITLLVGHPVTATCATNGYEGTVESSALVQLSPFICHQYASPYDDPYGRAAAASGLLVVIHEAEHLLRPTANEHDVECYAISDYVVSMRLLRVPRRFWASMYRAARAADRFYFKNQSADCPG